MFHLVRNLAKEVRSWGNPLYGVWLFGGLFVSQQVMTVVHGSNRFKAPRTQRPNELPPASH